MVHLGTTLIFIGFILIFIGMIAWLFLPLGRKVRGGGVIMIGPLPLIFGTDRESLKILLLLAIILMLVTAALIFVPVVFWRSLP
ncbi:MAG: TIGR00304 family membrane protein [Candidatus Bathyarchaeia archaeon]